MTESSAVIKARAEAERHKSAMLATLHQLQERLAPKTLANEAWEKAKSKGAAFAEDAVDAVKRRPVATGGIVAAALMMLLRQPIKDGVTSLYGKMTEQDEKPRRRAPRARKRAAPKPEKA
jgi:hypothetical protein